jgi:hypothetical protein
LAAKLVTSERSVSESLPELELGWRWLDAHLASMKLECLRFSSHVTT